MSQVLPHSMCVPCAAHGPFMSNCSWHCLPSFLAHPCWQVQGNNEVSQACKLTQLSSWTATVVSGMHFVCQNNSVSFQPHCQCQDCGVCSGHLYPWGSVSTSPHKDRPVRRVESKVGREPGPPGTTAFHLRARHLTPVSGVLERDAGSVAINALGGLLFKRKWHSWKLAC